MEKKTVGSFIAALRKASGMTQQEMADKLNVSNKAVSRWERNESAPDLSLIPVIAEIFDVSCDELLKGERITGNADTDRPSPKIEKQIKRLLNNTLSRFKAAVYIAVAGDLIGFVFLLAISYGFYKPIIGFAVLMVFVIASAILTLLSLSRLNDQAKDNELFDNLIEADVDYFKRVRYRFAFISFLIGAMSFLWSLPFIMVQDDYFVNSVIVFDEYISFIPLLILISLLTYIVCDTICRRLFLGEMKTFKFEKRAKALNILQFTVSAVIFTITIIVNLLNINASASSSFGIPALVFILLLMLIEALATAYFALKNKHDSRLLIITGLRNIGFFIAAASMLGAYFSVQSYIQYYGSQVIFNFFRFGGMQYIALPILIFTISFGGYMLLKKYWVKK